MNTKQILLSFLAFIILLSSCQQRYAHIPKVKAHPKAEQVREKSIELEQLPQLASSIEETEKISLIEPKKLQIPPQPETRSLLNIEEEKQLMAPLDSSLNESESEEKNDEPARLRDLDESDRVSIIFLAALAIALVAVLTGLLIGLLAFFLIAAIFAGAWEVILLALLVGILLLLFGSYFAAVLIIKGFLGRRLRPLEVLIILLLVYLTLGLISFFLPAIASLLLIVAAIIGIVSLVRGSKYRRGIRRDSLEGDE